MIKGVYGCVCGSLTLSTPWIRCCTVLFSTSEKKCLSTFGRVAVTVLRLGNEGEYVEEEDVEPEEWGESNHFIMRDALKTLSFVVWSTLRGIISSCGKLFTEPLPGTEDSWSEYKQ